MRLPHILPPSCAFSVFPWQPAEWPIMFISLPTEDLVRERGRRRRRRTCSTETSRRYAEVGVCLHRSLTGTHAFTLVYVGYSHRNAQSTSISYYCYAADATGMKCLGWQEQHGQNLTNISTSHTYKFCPVRTNCIAVTLKFIQSILSLTSIIKRYNCT